MSHLAAALSFVLITAASPCLADQADVSSSTLSLQGIEAGSSSGDAILHARLHQAVRQVCGEADTRDLATMTDMQACRARATLQGEAVLAARTRTRAVHSESKVAALDTYR